MKILVTGARGFIGSYLCKELNENGHLAIPTDLPVDLTVPGIADMLLRNYKPKIVIHLAAQVGRVLSEDDVVHTIKANAVMTTLVAKACANNGARLVYVSTSEAYGDQGLVTATEADTPVLPYNLYGLSKRWGEEVSELYAPEGLQILRLSMPYGPGLLAGRGKAAIVNILYQALHRKPIIVHKYSERAWCYITDDVRGIRMVVQNGHYQSDKLHKNSGIYNVGRDDNRLPMERVAEMACHMTGCPKSLIQMVDAPPNQTVVKRLSMNKLRRLGWEPKVELKEGMLRTLEFVRTLP